MKKILSVVSVACLAVACGSNLNEEDTRVAFASANVALAQGSAQAQAMAGVPAGAGGQAEGLAPRAAAQVDYNWSCTEGGTAHFTGNAEAVVSDTGSSNVNFDLTTDFDGCTVNGVSMSGALDYSAAVDASGTGSVSTTFTMKGNLDFSGKVDGSCEFDLTMAVDVSGGVGGGGTVGATFEGSICGHKASATLNVQG